MANKKQGSKKRKAMGEKRRRAETPPVEIDYAKLEEAIARAVLKAEAIQEEEKERTLEDVRKKRQELLNYKEYNGTSKLRKAITSFCNFFKVLWGIATFKKENVTDVWATYVLLSCFNCVFYSLLQFSLNTLVIWSLFGTFARGSFPTVFKFGWFTYLLMAVLFLALERIAKIAKLEAEKCNDKNEITSTFNAIVAFSSMVLAMLAVIIAVKSNH